MEWFKHDVDASTDSRVSVLRNIEGSIAVDMYFYILGQIYKYEEPFEICFVDTEEECECYTSEMRVLCGIMQTQCENAQRIVDVMVSLGLFQKIDDEITYSIMSDRASKAIQDASDKSQKARRAAETRWNNSERNANALHAQSDRMPLKTKDYKTKDLYKKESNKEKSRSRFVPPSLEEVESYISEKGYSVDAEAFIAFYESNGWKVGKNPMKSWKGAVTTWARRDDGKQSQAKEVTLDAEAQRLIKCFSTSEAVSQ